MSRRVAAVLLGAMLATATGAAGGEAPAPCARPAVDHPFTERERFRYELEQYRATVEAGRETAEAERAARLVDRAMYLARIDEYRRALTTYREGIARYRARACRWIGNQILAVRVDEAQPPATDQVIVRATYWYTGDRGDGMGMEAITFMHGESTGHWAYRPAKVSVGLNVARIQLGMNRDAPDRYESTELLVAFFRPGAETFDERMVPFARTWVKTPRRQ